MGQSIFLTVDPVTVPEDVDKDILFQDFYQKIYYSDMQGRLKPTTLASKHYAVCKKILPFFGTMPLRTITPITIRSWQNTLLSQNYSDTYLRTLDMTLFSIFKYGETYYDLPNPYARAEHIGSTNSRSMQFWTLQEYRTFSRCYQDQPKIYTAFELLYWTGMRVGELLALTPDDIDHKAIAIRITKTYASRNGQTFIQPPKTQSSIRTVVIPDFLYQEVCDYVKTAGLKINDRLFPHSPDFMEYHLKRGCEKTGVRRIRIHDIRHSHVSLLINNGFTAVAVASRVGHKHISTTMNVYSHLFPNRQAMLVDALEEIHLENTYGKEA